MKNIYIVLMILCLPCFVIADVTYYLDTNQWGNTKLGTSVATSTSSLATGGSVYNTTICMPFIAPQTGTIKQIYVSGVNTNCELHFCISDNVVLAAQESCGGWSTIKSSAWLDTPENITATTIAGETYYLCVQANSSYAGASSSCYLRNTGNVFAQPTLSILPTVQPLTDVTEGVLYPTDPTDMKISRNYQDASGAYNGWTVQSYMISNFHFCYDYSDECYSQTAFTSNVAYFPFGSQNAGQVFKYRFSDSTVTDISIAVSKDGDVDAGDYFLIGLYEWDWATNTTGTILYNSTPIYGSDLPSTSTMYFINHTLNTNPTLHQDQYYAIEVECITCGAGEDFFWQGSVMPEIGVGYGFDLNDSMSYGTGYMRPDFDSYFVLTMSDDIWSATYNSTYGTNCTIWTNPYILKEDFTGYLELCDWATSDVNYYSGYLTRQQSDPYYVIYKDTDLLSSINQRYFASEFDIKPTNMASNGYVSFALYDDNEQRYLQILFMGTNATLYNNDNGNAVAVYTNVSQTTSTNVKVVFDFSADTFDLYYGGAEVASDLDIINPFINVETQNAVSISSSSAGYELSDLQIYACDQNGNIIAYEGDLPTTTPNANLSMCGLFVKSSTTCASDSDCVTGLCMPNGYCSQFDWTYCDENGYVRGNMCMMKAMTYCFLDSTATIILDNFLLFLVFLVVVIIIIYITLTLRTR